MFIKKLPCLLPAAQSLGVVLSLVSCLLTAACVGNRPTQWNTELAELPVGAPSQIKSDFDYPELGVIATAPSPITMTSPGNAKTVAVLLPDNTAGRGISKSVEMAFLRREHNNISVNFYDLTGNTMQKQNIITNVLMTEPDIVIGPLFAADASMIRDTKPADLPVLSFTSDMNALGGGVMTMALVPAQSIEAVVHQMSRDRATRVIILAPKTASGELMAGASLAAAGAYDISVSGLLYYNENDTESIKEAAKAAAMYDARVAANNRARQVLSDILVKETLTPAQKSSLRSQLDKISRADTIGRAPFDAVLFLGTAADSKSLASFLRYYDVANRDANFYGTTLWDGDVLATDLTMSGAKFATMPAADTNFVTMYEHMTGTRPTRLDGFGFDAANLAIGMLYSSKSPAAYLLDPSGYRGLDGLFRLRPNGISERALEIVELNGTGTPRVMVPAPSNFMAPLYNINPANIRAISDTYMNTDGINPMDFISIPDNLRSKYKSKTFGANTTSPVPNPQSQNIEIMPEDDREIVTNPEFTPIGTDRIDRKLIDVVEISE